MFGAGTGYGGDVIALSSGRIDQGRMELHQAVEAEMTRTGLDYPQALDSVVAQAKHGLRMLSQAALKGTGVRAVRPGRNGLRHDPTSGEVVTLAAGTAVSLAEPPVAQEHSPRFADAVSYCVAQRPEQAGRGGDAAAQRLIERCDPATADRQITRWLSQGGAQAAFK